MTDEMVDGAGPSQRGHHAGGDGPAPRPRMSAKRKQISMAMPAPGQETNLYWATTGEFTLRPALQGLVGHDPETNSPKAGSTTTTSRLKEYDMKQSLSTSEQIALAVRFLRDLPGFLRTPLTPEACRARARHGLETREANFLDMLERAVFAQPASPYRKLLGHAGATLSDVRDLVRREGLEATLERLHDAGVYVTLAEFKGRVPIRRGSLAIEANSRHFDNPLLVQHIELQTGGSTGKATPLLFNLVHYAQEAVYDFNFLDSFEILDRPYGIWRPPPPYHAGLWAILDQGKLGRKTDKWFAQDRLSARSRAWREALVIYGAVFTGRLCGRPLPMPEHVPLDEAWRVAEWLAQMKGAGSPALFNTNAACGVRVCAAARERGIDISGTLFRLGGEPLTPAKARIVAETGSKAVCHYGGGEAGRLGIACRYGSAPDDVHLLLDKIAFIRRPPAGNPTDGVLANVLTTLLPTTPKLMLNFENGDHGVVEERRCGCLFDKLGYPVHLHTIRSYEKLTSEGMNFLSHDLVRLIDEVLPSRFQAAPTDFQLVEDETPDGLPQVYLVVSPRINGVSEGDMACAVVEFLNDLPGAGGAFGERWREGGTLRVVRREPYATHASKVLPLHTMKRMQEQAVHGGV
jgi:hypothetical protein